MYSLAVLDPPQIRSIIPQYSVKNNALTAIDVSFSEVVRYSYVMLCM